MPDVVSANGPRAAATAGPSVGDVFAATARSAAAAAAVDDGDRSLTYAELDERVNRLGNVLLGAGITPGQTIAILSRNSIAYLEVLLATAKIGAIAGCLNWRLAAPEIEHCLGLAAPAMLLVEPEFEALVAATAFDDTPGISLGEDYEKRLASAAADPPPSGARGEDGLLILYTSGTTGYPKGALISHRASLFRAMVYATELEVPRNDTFIAWSPLFHIGSADQSIATLLRGGRVFVADGFDEPRILQALGRYRTQWLSVLPGIADRLIAALDANRATLRGIGIVGGMADLVAPEQVAEISRLCKAPYLDSFGSTETGIAPGTGSLIPIGEAPARLVKRQTIGCRVRLVDEDGNDVPDGSPGEVAFRGLSLFSGYVDDDAANRASFRDGWYRMGDVMRRDRETGGLEFVDRLKYLIKSGGENIYPAEIERLLLADPRIAEAAVVRAPDRRWGEVPVAFVATSDESLTGEDVMRLCEGRLARYKRPKAVRFLPASDFPRGSTGKILRRELERRLRPD